MDQARLRRMMSGESVAAGDRALRLGLGALAPAYRAAVAGRNRLFDAGVLRPIRLGRPTISVGNLTAGGTGKTPLVIHLVRRLVEMGARPAVLTRGYHGGDEAAQMRAELGGAAAVEANADRVAGAKAVLAAHPQTSVFILDDGFQHRRVRRDLDLVLVDAMEPFGHGRLLPRGLLREPVGNLRRADGVIVTRCEQVTRERIEEIDGRVVALTGRSPLAHAAMRWTAMRTEEGEVAVEALRGRRVVGVCGIGNPAAFERTLREAAGEVASVWTFGDHYRYAAEDAARVEAAAQAAGAEAVVMTEKDWVKWAALGRAAGAALPVYRPVLSIEFVDGGEAIDGLLRARVV